MLTHLPLRHSGTRLQDTLCPGHRCFEDFTSRQLGLSQPTPPMSATLTERRTRTTLDLPRRQVHITSIPDHQHTCKVQESTPASQHGPNHTVQTILKRWTNMAIRLITGRLQQWSNVCKNKFTKEDSMRYTKLQKMFATTCGVHKPP